MNSDFGEALNQLAEEKGLDKGEVLKMIEASLAAAFRKDYGEKDQNVVVKLDPETMAIKVFDVKTVVEDVEDAQKEVSLEDAKGIDKKYKVEDEISLDVTPKAGAQFGRIAAQTAKQVIVQKLREAERNVLFAEYKAKERQLVTGIVQRIENTTVLVDLGRATGALFPSEQIRDEEYRIGQRLKVLILHVEPTTKGPKVTLSRSHPDMVRRLFELEVPEIHNGIVEIKALAREAGSRSKVAVWSNQEGIDPIGACVGQRGTRVQTVMAELGGEKIDIIEWNEDTVKFISNALSPAKILNVTLSDEAKDARVGVMEDQLSLAIGKAGQNVRLAARLTGWKIDIVEEKIGDEENGPDEPDEPDEKDTKDELAPQEAEAEEKAEGKEETKGEVEKSPDEEEEPEDTDSEDETAGEESEENDSETKQ